MTDTSPEPVQVDPKGVDLSLVRWLLAMRPAERLAALQDIVDAVWEARGGEDAA